MIVYNMLATEQNTLENLKLEEKIKSTTGKVVSLMCDKMYVGVPSSLYPVPRFVP